MRGFELWRILAYPEGPKTTIYSDKTHPSARCSDWPTVSCATDVFVRAGGHQGLLPTLFNIAAGFAEKKCHWKHARQMKTATWCMSTAIRCGCNSKAHLRVWA